MAGVAEAKGARFSRTNRAGWIELLPDGYLRNAAQDLLTAVSASPPDPVALLHEGVLAVMRELSQ